MGLFEPTSCFVRNFTSPRRGWKEGKGSRRVDMGLPEPSMGPMCRWKPISDACRGLPVPPKAAGFTSKACHFVMQYNRVVYRSGEASRISPEGDHG